MTRKRTIATMAAFGGMTAAMALLSGQPAAKADELSDLRVNQELLQQRIDQLAQIPAIGGQYGGGPAGPTNVQMMGGSFPRSFLVPGTDTSIRVGGRATLVTNLWITGGNPQNPNHTAPGNNGSVNVLPLHVHTPGGNFQRSRGDMVFGMTPRQSVVSFETRTPTAWGEARSFISFDFNNPNASPANMHVSDNLAPRLLFAYGTLGPLLFGQANSNFSDADAGAETLDYGGNIGNQGVTRLPQVRWTQPLAPWGIVGALSVSAEAPETDFWTPGNGLANSDSATGYPTSNSSPDFTAAWYIPQPWGHMDFAAVVRPTLKFKDGNQVDKTYTGFGFAMGGDVKPRWFGWDRDYIVFRAVGGQGIGRYVNSNSSFALVSNFPNAAAPATAAQAANILVKPVSTMGGDVGYQHHWTPTLRSNISGGFWRQEIPTGLRTVTAAGTTTGVSAVCSNVPAGTAGTPAQNGVGACGALSKEQVTAHANVIWAPVPFADIGVEYVYGHRIALSNLKGDEHVILTRFQLNF